MHYSTADAAALERCICTSLAFCFWCYIIFERHTHTTTIIIQLLCNTSGSNKHHNVLFCHGYCPRFSPIQNNTTSDYTYYVIYLVMCTQLCLFIIAVLIYIYSIHHYLCFPICFLLNTFVQKC